MALRSPVEFHNFWGQFSLYSDLPNVAGSSTSSVNLQTGDVAYVTGTSLLHFCTDATVGAAVWTSTGGGGGGQDRFAPKYVVGNTLAPWNDSAVPYASGGFTYFPDPGDGTGIEAALAAADASAGEVTGDVWIRPGVYDLKLTNGTIAIDVSGNNNVIVSNVSGATTPVQNTGAGNEVAHNI